MSLISINIHIDRLSDVLATFDRIEVHRSTAGLGGPFTEITDLSGPTAAQVDGTAAGGFTLNGLLLEIEVDNVTQQITFSGVDPLDIATVISQINAVVSGLASEVPTDTDMLRLVSVITGTGSTLQVTASTAATALGLATTRVAGKVARIALIDPTTDYRFLDLDGAEAYFYQTRYSSTTSPTVSEFSDPRQGSLDVVAPSDELIKAELRLLNGAGKPVVGRCVRFILQTIQPVATTTYQAIPGVDASVFVVTTETGYATINLLKGGQYRMVIEGTAFIRDFTVPATGPFDVLALAGTSPDPFDIVQAPILAIKVTI